MRYVRAFFRTLSDDRQAVRQVRVNGYQRVVMLCADQPVLRAVVGAAVRVDDDEVGQRESLSQRVNVEHDAVERDPRAAVAAPRRADGQYACAARSQVLID